MENLKELRKETEKIMREHGYIVHSVFPSEKDTSGKVSHHTHGLKENFNHMDLEIALAIHPNLARAVLGGVAEQIKSGEVFEDKLMSDKIIQGYNVQLFKMKSDNRELLRIVLPDENGKFPFEKDCMDGYKNQLDDLKVDKLS